MGRVKAEDNKRRDHKGRILPPNVVYRPKQQDYMWRKTYKGVSYPPVYEKDLCALKKMIPELEDKVYKGTVTTGLTKLTLNDCFEKMMEEKEDISGATKANYIKYWNRYIKFGLGAKDITKITKEEIKKKYKTWLNKSEGSLSWGTIKYIHTLVYGAFEWEMENGHMGRNPAKNALNGIMHEKKNNGERSLTEEEEIIFFNYVDNHKNFKYHGTLLHTLRDYGLRAGEGIAICLDALKFEDGYIEICRSLNYKDNVGDGKRRKYFTNTKSECSNRTLPLLKKSEKRIRDYLEMREIIGRECIEDIDGHSDFIFVTQSGTTYTVDYLDQLIHRIIISYNKKEEKDAEKEKREPIILKQFSSHTFRHTFAQRLADKGESEFFIRDWLGHSNVRTTRIYAKPNWRTLLNTLPGCLK